VVDGAQTNHPEQASVTDRLRLSERDARWLEATYRELHEGLPLDAARRVEVFVPVRPVTELGALVEIEYVKPTPRGPVTYWHPFAAHARPMLFRDARGRLFVHGTRYVVTTAGIEDLPGSRATRAAVTERPDLLVSLGTLHWLKYRNEHGSQVLRFEGDARPIVAHDESAKLHFVRGNYRVEANPMAHRRRRSYRHHAIMANPSKSGSSDWQSHALITFKMAALVGASAVASGLALTWAFAKAPALNPYVRGLSKVALGVAVPVISSMTLPIPPDLLSGFAIAGVTAGGMDLYATVRAMRTSTQQQQPTVTRDAQGNVVPPAFAAGGSAGLYNAVRPRAVAGMRY
jgi:hypothetical protein